jgi:hypothetical protein
VTGSSKRKGDRAELEVQALLREALGVPARRKLGAGRRDDIGDIDGVPNTVIQVVDWKDIAAAVRAKPNECERQRVEYERLVGEPTFGATFVRLRGGDYRVVLTTDQFFALWREAA